MGSKTHLRLIIIVILACIFIVTSACGGIVPTASSNTPTPTQVITKTASLTETPTVAATVTQGQQLLDHMDEPIVHDLLSSDNCEDTCVWGIDPGTSTKQDIEQFLLDFAKFGWVYENLNWISIDLDFDGELVYLSLDYEADSEQVITLVHGSSRSLLELFDPRQQPDLSLYNYLLEPWMMANVVDKFGTPTQIAMSLESNTAEPNAPDFFVTWLVYPNEGLIIEYESSAQVNSGPDRAFGSLDDIALVCPTKAFVEVWLLADNSERGINDILSDITYYWTDYQVIPAEFKSVNDVLGISISEFSQRALNRELGCFDTYPGDWPIIH